jgi:hypothetical protein
VLKPGMPADAVIRWQADAPWITPDGPSARGSRTQDRGDIGK